MNSRGRSARSPRKREREIGHKPRSGGTTAASVAAPRLRPVGPGDRGFRCAPSPAIRRSSPRILFKLDVRNELSEASR